MNFSAYYQSMSKIEFGMLALFIIYLTMDIYPPEILASYIDTSANVKLVESGMVATVFVPSKGAPAVEIITLSPTAKS